MTHSPEVVVITGASAGVGRATARLFARRGAQIGLMARDRERLEATRKEIEDLGGRAVVLVADAANAAQIDAAAERVERELGPIDIWINNAMATIFAPFEEVTPSEFCRATEVTYLGCVYGTMAALKRMKARDKGVIVQVGSALAYRSIPLQSAYCGAKHAVIGFTDSLRSELLHDGSNVHLTVVNLPALNTPQFEWSRTRLPRHPQPVPPIFQPEVAAEAIVWAAHHRRREVDVGFPTVKATTAQKIVPGLADRYLAKNGYDGQQTEEPIPPDRPDNLFDPVPGDYAARGSFDSEARGQSVQFFINKHRSKFALGGSILAAGLLAWRKFGEFGDGDRSLELQRSVSVPEFPRAENRPHILYAWRGPSMLVVDEEGAAGGPDNSGFFFRQTRYLRELRLQLFGESAYPCSSAEIATNEIEFTYVYPEKKGGGSDRGGERNGIPYGGLDLRVLYTVHPNGLGVRLRAVNRSMQQVKLDLSWALDADFADYSETFGERKQRARVETRTEVNGIRFRYHHPQLPLETLVRIDGGASWKFSDGRLSTELDLDNQSEKQISLEIRAIDLADPIDDRGAAAREARLLEWRQKAASVEAPADAPIAVMTNRGVGDVGSLALLEGPEEEWLAPAAGIPLFQSLWARDALTAVWHATMFDRGEMADSVLSVLGRLQGKIEYPWRDEQPGRIIRGMQRSPLARLNMNPTGLYYGDYASPFAFIFALAQLYAWSGDKKLLLKHYDAARSVLEWAQNYGDIDGDGYLEYKTLSSDGPKHQGWRDSQNAIVYPDGTQADTPIAACEIQGYWFAALQIMAVLAAVAGEVKEAAMYWSDARKLKERFNRDFWMPDQDCIALALDRDKKQIRDVTSNAGQTLTTGIINREHLPRLVKRLFAPDIFSGWGLRTLSTKNPAYNPLSYHLGSVWLVSDATFLFGLKRFGFEREVHTLARAIYDLGLMWRDHRVPECVGGYSREESGHPGAYPQANAPQTWNQSAFAILIQSLLGILPVASLNLLTVYPVLPDWMPELTVRNLRVGDATATIRFRRGKNGSSGFEVLEKRGTLHIMKQPPIESLTAGIWDRLGILAKEVKAA